MLVVRGSEWPRSCWVTGSGTPRKASSIPLATMTGVAHFVGMRDELVEMVPPSLPAPGMLVTITGVLEFAGAAGLVYRRTSLAASTGLTLLMIAMFPANVHATRESLSYAFADKLVRAPSWRS